MINYRYLTMNKNFVTLGNHLNLFFVETTFMLETLTAIV